MNTKKILITGVQSGIGRYLHEKLGGIGLTRATHDEAVAKAAKEGVDVIIHCAFNSAVGVTSDTLMPYFEDNVYLTEELVKIPHKTFIYFSTVEVYHGTDQLNEENTPIPVNSRKSIYAVTKLLSEAIVKKNCKSSLILRPSTLLGAYSRLNTVLKCINDAYPCVSPEENSVYNLVLYSDVLDFINTALANNLTGTYNLVSSKNISLKDIAKKLGKKVKFGKHLYNVTSIPNAKASKELAAFKKTSADVLAEFIKNII